MPLLLVKGFVLIDLSGSGS